MIGANLPGVQIWVATTPIDIRKSFDALAEVVRKFLQQDPQSGHLFVFRNKRGHLLKILWWDQQGLAIYYKRLEHGEFRFPRGNAAAIEVTADQLLRLLAGMEVADRRAG